MNQHRIDRRFSAKNNLAASETLEKNFYYSVKKAINSEECPVKEKHIRVIIIGTYQKKSSDSFWYHVNTLHLEESPVICWKFCHVLHKLLRDGHPKVIRESRVHRSKLLELGKVWGLMRYGYGLLIQNYCSLLVNKMDFHNRNPKFPGNLCITEHDWDSIFENDVNVFFQLCCEIFDYMDEILCLQTNVFNSLDSMRFNSMTTQGRCRLAPLIMCIQDSSQLYDFTVKILFKLHSELPPATLEGHRDRFNSQFKLLKTFYNESRSLEYFKTLVKIPPLPDRPPNFFNQSNLQNHVTPVVVIPQEEPITEANLLDLTFDDNDSDKSDNASLWSFQPEPNHTTPEQQIIQDKDRIIERLCNRIEELEVEMRNTKAVDEKKIAEYKRSIAEFECAEAQRMEKEIEFLKSTSQAENQNAKMMEKYNKLKDFYEKLRTEHLELIRKKSEADKHLAQSRNTIEELQTVKQSLDEKLRSASTKEAEVSFFELKISELTSKVAELQKQNQDLNEKLTSLTSANSEIQTKLTHATEQAQKFESQSATQKIESQQKLKQTNKFYLMNLINESLGISKQIMDEELELGFASVNCSPQYFCSQVQILISKFDQFEKDIAAHDYTSNLFRSAFFYYYQIFYMINCSKTIIRNIPNIELSEELLSKCKAFVAVNFDLGGNIDKDFNGVNVSVDNVKQSLHEIYKLTEKIVPEFASNKNLDLETQLNNEMEQMDKAIQDAVTKIEQMMAASSQRHSGIKLEVNEKILNACTSLMQAIKQLILDSKQLQQEIALKEKGSSSMKEFYQRNHRWTEGLISAAKTVAADANLLVESADKIICGTGKLEELMAASQEIAASCAQLVVASRVKADSASKNLANLSKSSKSVLQETGNVIATTKHCYKLIDESDVSDFSTLSLHQAKRMEMECQVKVLELENSLEKERRRLASIRRTHYHLAESLSNSTDGKQG